MYEGGGYSGGDCELDPWEGASRPPAVAIRRRRDNSLPNPPSANFAIRYVFNDGLRKSDLPAYYYGAHARRFVERLMKVLAVLKTGHVYGPRDCYFNIGD